MGEGKIRCCPDILLQSMNDNLPTIPEFCGTPDVLMSDFSSFAFHREQVSIFPEQHCPTQENVW